MYNFTKGCYNMLSGAGVYIFYHKDSVLYVGQTGDFKSVSISTGKPRSLRMTILHCMIT